MKAIDKALDNPLQLALGVVLILGVVYYLGKKTIKDTADVAASIVSGDNAVTRNQTNASGEKTDAYVGKGVVGTLGAGANSASGGWFASVGESLGGWAFDLFGPSYNPNAPVYTVRFPDGSRHAIDSNNVQSNGYFSYGSVKYRLGKDSSGYVATRVQ